MKSAFTFLCLLSFSLIYSQENFDFELHDGASFTSWNSFGQGDFKESVATDVFQSGTSSALIESTGDGNGFKALGYDIPATFGGEKITLTGYVKTENVADGWAGLWMRIDPQVAFDNMQQRGITGTTDWEQYTITLPLKPNEAQKIVIGGLLSGSGKMWIDNLEVTIDGKSLENAPAKQLTGAQRDTRFDAGSNFEIDIPSTQEVENLTVLGQVWGFLKYHHPVAANGDINWDYELFEVMDDIAFVKADNARDTAILEWINSYGEVPTCKKCKPTSPAAAIKPDHKWMTSSGLSPALVTKLKFIYENRYQGNHYYIGSATSVMNPVFQNENLYSSMTYPDDGFRLLSLYRLWNAIYYYFPYKNSTDKDWNTVLAEYIPSILAAQDELAYEKVMVQVIGDIKDTHANLWSGADKLRESRGDKLPPVRTKFVENKLVIVDFFDLEKTGDMGLALGDVISTINGKSVGAMVDAELPFYPASNPDARMRDIALDILNGDTDFLELEIERDGKSMTIKLPLYDTGALERYSWYPQPEEEKSYKMLPNNIGYITLANVTNEDPQEIKKLFKDTDGIIIDIRNYPSAFMPFSLGTYFAPEDTPFVKFTRMNIDNPGEFVMGEPLQLSTGSKKSERYRNKVVVLVNELSQSQAEYTTMAFQAGSNTTVIGSTTAGADGNVSSIPLPGGMRTMISGIGVFYPDGTPTQRVGVRLDEEVHPTIAGIKAGKDELLDRAIAIIQQQ